MFCPDCGTWNRSAAKQCAKCSAGLPDVRVASEAPDGLITALRQAMGNRYRIIRRLGAGGMADVYAAEHEQLGRPLAVKVMHAHLARDNEMRERFRREAEAASRLVHPLICTPIDYGEAGEVVYLVLPYLGGGCLADDLNKTRVIEPNRTVRIAAKPDRPGLLALNIGATPRADRSDLTGVDHDHRLRRPKRGYIKTQREDFQLPTTRGL